MTTTSKSSSSTDAKASGLPDDYEPCFVATTLDGTIVGYGSDEQEAHGNGEAAGHADPILMSAWRRKAKDTE